MTACTFLQELYINSVPVGAEAFTAIAGLGELRALDIGNTDRPPDDGVTDHYLRGIARGCLKLCALDLSSCRRLTDKGFGNAAQDLTGLIHLGLQEIATDQWLQAIIKHCIGLKALDIRNAKVTRDGVFKIARAFNHESFFLSISQLSVKGFNKLRAQAPSFKIRCNTPDDEPNS